MDIQYTSYVRKEYYIYIYIYMYIHIHGEIQDQEDQILSLLGQLATTFAKDSR